MEKYNLDELILPCLKKLLCNFHMIYNFTITITRILLAIFKVKSNTLNPDAMLYVGVVISLLAFLK